MIRNGVDAGSDPAPLPEEPVIGFHGTLSSVTNRRAALRLVNGVLPAVRRHAPEARALIIGREPPEQLATEDGVTVTGEVDDVRPWLERVAVYVAPLDVGSGIKNKVLEAMAAARPVVATERALNGIGAGDGVVLARSDDAIADAAVELLRDRDRAAALGRAGRARVQREFSWTASADAIEALWAEVARR